MNKKPNNTLSPSDKKLLALLNSRFELAETILGTEPAIYYMFNVLPAPDSTETTQLMNQRQEMFIKMTPGKVKKP